MTYVAPLRCAVLYLCDHALHWDELSVAMLSHVSFHQSRCYCSHLVGAGVLATRRDCLQPGWAFAAWRKRLPRTRPGGNSRDFHDEQEEREQLYQQQQRLRAELGARISQLREEKGLGKRALCREARIGVRNLSAYESGKWQPTPATVAKLELVLGGSLHG
jgi:hypothetical protein